MNVEIATARHRTLYQLLSIWANRVFSVAKTKATGRVQKKYAHTCHQQQLRALLGRALAFQSINAKQHFL